MIDYINFNTINELKDYVNDGLIREIQVINIFKDPDDKTWWLIYQL